MGNIINHFFLPHPPVAIPKVGGKTTAQLSKTIEGFQNAAQTVAEQKPDTIIVITPHGPCFHDMFYIPSQKRISGDFSAFGCKKLILGFDNDLELANLISEHTKNHGLNAGFANDATMKRHGIPYDLDHGVTVPLYFLSQKYRNFKILPISIAGLNGKEHYRFGILLREAIRHSNRRVILIASGNLSHKLSKNTPYGYSEDGIAFDKSIRKLLLTENAEGFLTLSPKEIEKAAPCGINAYRIVLGTLDGFRFLPRILSYEAPLGTGYLCAELTCGKATESIFTRFLIEDEQRKADLRTKEHSAIQLARYAIDAFLHGEKNPSIPPNTPKELSATRGGVFVSLYNDGEQCGCMGTIQATHPNLAEEIMYNAICAATKDRAYSPLGLKELNDITITVDIVHTPEEITDKNQIDPQKYGIIVENRNKIGIMLPKITGIETPEAQISAARERAGIHPWHRLKIQRFSVTHYE